MVVNGNCPVDRICIIPSMDRVLDDRVEENI